MIRTFIAFVACVLTAVIGCGPQSKGPQDSSAPAAAPRVERSFFNGKDLTGWSGPAMQYWSVEEGAIVGKSEKPIPQNEFLWSSVEVRDFYLSVDVKLEPNERNAGIQFRSQKLPPNEALGYQADMGKAVWGRLYHESGRKKLDWRERGEAAVKPGEWNRYEILAVGHRIWTAINGKLAVSVNDPAGERKGYIALQVHSGGPLTARYRINALVHNPKVELAGLSEKQLDAELIAPEKDPTAGAKPATRGTTRPGGRPATRAASTEAQPSPVGQEARASSPAAGTPASSPALSLETLKKETPTGDSRAPRPGEDAGVPGASAAVVPPPVPEPPEKRFGDPPPAVVADPHPPFANGTFALRDGEVVVFTGQTNMVRAQQDGNLEAHLAVAYADRKPKFRSMAWEGDTVYQQWRDLNFGGWRNQLTWVGATVVIAQFGQTEALDGSGKLADFAAAYGRLVDEWSAVTRRIVLVSPIPFERPADALLPDLTARNDDIRAYAQAVKKLATERGLVFVDLHTPSNSGTDDSRTGRYLTSNGIHLTPDGHREIAASIARQLGVSALVPPAKLEPIRRAVAEKNQLWFDNWRPMNWAFAYGDRQHVPFSRAINDHPPLRIEFEQFKPLVKQADQKVQELAATARSSGL